jgi:diaminopimelate epimerase
MNLHFVKYEGSGNDFIIIDNRNKILRDINALLVRKLCGRKFGIGADGFMLLQNKEGFDFEMIYYNSDGNEGSMCGNGGRCIVAFAHSLGIIKDEIRFWAVDGEHKAQLLTPSLREGEKKRNQLMVNLKMINVNQLEIGEDYLYLNTGSPHFVKFVKDLKNLDVYNEGGKIRYNERFKNSGTNVNFVEEFSDHLFVRTYERGVENETLSCGTGVTASALAWAMKNNLHSVQKCKIHTPGGDLWVKLNRNTTQTFHDIWLEGPATFVFKGEIDV